MVTVLIEILIVLLGLGNRQKNKNRVEVHGIHWLKLHVVLCQNIRVKTYFVWFFAFRTKCKWIVGFFFKKQQYKIVVQRKQSKLKKCYSKSVLSNSNILLYKYRHIFLFFANWPFILEKSHQKNRNQL